MPIPHGKYLINSSDDVDDGDDEELFPPSFSIPPLSI